MQGRRVARWTLPVITAYSIALSSCGDRLVQTADRSDPAATGGSGAALDCSSPSSGSLPPGAVFGEGDALVAPLSLNRGYSAHEGPGIYVVARDTYRVYVNGDLVGQSEAPRQPQFIPLTLFPGKSVIAVSVHASEGAPVALVAVDELDRAYGSGSDWKVSTTPEADWQNPDFDDSAWASASERSPLGTLGSCEPGAAFPANTRAVWIGSELPLGSPIALRKTLSIEPVGYASGVTGGGDSRPQKATTWTTFEALLTSDSPATILLDEGLYDFRRTGSEVTERDVCSSVCTNDSTRTVYQGMPSGSTCAATVVSAKRDERILNVGSNKTLVGLGRGAQLRGVALDIGSSANVIIRNVALFDINHRLLESEDALNLQEATGVWLDHLTVRWASDAFADILAGTEGITISSSLFDGNTDGECGGQERWGMSVTDSQVTIHKCRFDHLSTHAPFIDGESARAHLFNNVFSNSSDWTVGSSCLAQVRLEGNVFENVQAATRLSTCDGTSDRGLMNAIAGTNLYRDGTATHLGGDGSEPHDEVFTPEYSYQVELATDAWPQVILRAGAGGPWAQPLSLD